MNLTPPSLQSQHPAQSQSQSQSQRRAENLAALVAMGFECVAGPVTNESRRVDRGRWKLTQSVPAMGTIVAVSVVHRSCMLAEEAIGRSLQEMARLVLVLNRFDDASALGVLNSEGTLEWAPAELVGLLETAAKLHRLSDGAFDITVQPVVDLLRECSGAPSVAALAEAIARVDSSRVRIGRHRVQLEGDGMGITLDGIAKGFIVDRMAAALAAEGAENYLINAGGDIRTAGAKEGGGAWTVAVRDPERPQPLPERVCLHDGAIATSGSYEIYFDRERTWHHLVRSDSGRSPQQSSSVTVCAPSTVQADALATAVFVMGPAAGMRLIEALAGCECLIVSPQQRLIRSTGWGSPALAETRRQ